MTHTLLTPGPLSTAPSTKAAMRRDWAARDAEFIALSQRVRRRLIELVGGEETHDCVLLAGSGTGAAEAAIQSLVPRDGHMLVLVNGAYGARAEQIAIRTGRSSTALRFSETEPTDPGILSRHLRDHPQITHVFMVYCETTTGIRNPLEQVASVTRDAGCTLILDAVSAIGALPLDCRALSIGAIIGTANKCLESAPGLSFVIADRRLLAAAANCAGSLYLDLHLQWRSQTETGEWRFTAPTHVTAALDHALDLLDHEGGRAARFERYMDNYTHLSAGMSEIGFKPVIPLPWQAPIVVTYEQPQGLKFDEFYDRLKRRGFIIYPGKVHGQSTFRIGCIGAITKRDMTAALRAIRTTMQDMRWGADAVAARSHA